MVRQVKRALGFIWRWICTDFCFGFFGAGALILTFVVFPMFHFVAWSFQLGRTWAHRKCQFCVHLCFGFLIRTFRFLGLMTYEIHDADKLRGLTGTLIVANHPTLLDVVFILSMVPHSLCVVKKAAWTNPFLLGIMHGTGYIKNDDPLELVDRCVDGLKAGNNLVIFPEATRTVPGQPMKLKRGAASIISKLSKPFVPITITCSPLTLTKGAKWYLPPFRKPHYHIRVHDAYDPEPETIDIQKLSLSNRYVNRILERLFLSGIQLHG